MSDTELLPCPFCGGEPSVHDTKTAGTEIECRRHDGGIVQIWGTNYTTALGRWNRRARSEAQPVGSGRTKAAGQETGRIYTCPNCDEAMPDGCGGTFQQSDGQSCWLNRNPEEWVADPFEQSLERASPVPAAHRAELGRRAEAAESALAELQGRSSQDAQDARRYRWLRDKFYAVGAPAIYWNCESFEPSGTSVLIGETLDAAIDAAIGGEK